jgi:hypothetical protein
MGQYLDKVNKDGFGYKSLSDVKAGDYARLLQALSEPWVQNKLFTL